MSKITKLKQTQGQAPQSFISTSKATLSSLTAAALILPGLIQTTAQAAEEDSVDFQYSHYQEGRREGTYTDANNIQTNSPIRNIRVPNSRNPIEVDSVHGSARVSLTDRIKFAFNYNEDSWSGATPYGSAPERSAALSYKNPQYDNKGNPTISGASAFDATKAYFDSKGNPLYQVTDPNTGQQSYLKDRVVHVMGYASPEIRQQGDFKLGYEWDEAALDIGGGISTEHDYESRFVNLGGRMDFNKKLTTVNLGLSYTNSDINADIGYGVNHFANTIPYQNEIDNNHLTGQHLLHGIRQDWATHLGLTQVINQDAVMELGMGYTRGTGFLENPYKLSWFVNIDPNDPIQASLPNGVVFGSGHTEFIEQRPDARNQWNWSARWVQYIEPLDAALHFGYTFAHDDWDINAHTFDADWAQPLGAGWTLTPRIRYYSQEAANFYKPFFVVSTSEIFSNGTDNSRIIPQYFSSDQRLSGYGTLSGGLTLSKQFAKGINLEAGFEYYTHQGSLKLGGGGEQAFADYDYWVANAALKVNLSALANASTANASDHKHATNHANIPAGILFAHSLDKAGDMMAGYRYQHSQQAGNFLQGNHTVSEEAILSQGCPGSLGTNPDGTENFNGNCQLLPKAMTMNMHMLELMVAPTDWLTLMLMPQFVDMSMPLYQPASLVDPNDTHSSHAHGHETGGIGDTGMYVLVNLFNQSNQHLHASMGVSAPTGDVGIKLRDGVGLKDLDGAYNHYGMQLGSGTWDLKPSLTYLGKAGDWSWGAQLAGTKRLENNNKSGYALGDLFEANLWGGYDLTNWLSTTVRVGYTWQGAIKGHYPTGRKDKEVEDGDCPNHQYVRADDLNGDGIPDGAPYLHQNEYNLCLASLADVKLGQDTKDRPTPMDFSGNYGGQYVDLGLGISATIPTGALAGNKLSFEWLQPVYTNVNGYQLDRDGALSFTWSYGF
jgi:hypothetical protein